MNEPKHTPGPWKAGRNNVGTGTVQIRDALGDSVAYATCSRQGYGDKQNDAEAMANARLIAAAPETAAERDRLREALAEMTGIAEADCLDDKSNVWRSAIINSNAALANTTPARPDVNAELLAALVDAAAMLEVYTSPAGRNGPNASTNGQARATIRDARAAIARAKGE